MRANLYYGFLVLLVGTLYLTACDNATTGGDNFEESIQLYTDLEPVPGALNTRAIINRGENVQANFGKAAGSDSWFQIKLENIGPNEVINNGTVGAWCIEWKKPLDSNNDVHEGNKIYSTAGSEKWKPINYFFSIKRDLEREDPTLTAREFQAVVWSLAGYIGIAPEFDVMKLSNNELPGRLTTNGEPNFSKEKVVSIVNRVISEYASKSKSTSDGGVTVMETDGDQQDVVIPDPPPVIEVDTNIFIYFDASGSMNSTLSPLQTMRTTQLKDALLPLYDNDGAAYDARVQILSPFDEHTFEWFNLSGATVPSDGNVIVLIFQDEAITSYHTNFGWTTSTTRTLEFDSHITTLRSALDGYLADPTKGSTYFRGVMFQVENSCCPSFKELITAVETGSGNYAPPYGLSDRSEFNYVYDVVDGDTPETYRDLIIQALQDLGFAIPTP